MKLKRRKRMLVKKFLCPSLTARVIAGGSGVESFSSSPFSLSTAISVSPCSLSQNLSQPFRLSTSFSAVPSLGRSISPSPSPDVSSLSRSVSRPLSPPFPLSADLSLRLRLPTFPLSPDQSLDLFLRRSLSRPIYLSGSVSRRFLSLPIRPSTSISADLSVSADLSLRLCLPTFPLSAESSLCRLISPPVKSNMGHDYSYSQPSESEDLFCNSVSSGFSETDDLIRRDQAEISLQAHSSVQYPPQPEVEFGFPQICYCGAQPLLATSTGRNNPGRRYYTCVNADDGECHIWKWWDVAVMEEMRARDRHVIQLADKVDNLTLSIDYETQQKMVRLEKLVTDITTKKSFFTGRFEYFVGATVLVLVLIGTLHGLVI
ncbi:hypothetical protein IGI04_021418 [Brassica rapa subsp. trilocularis]|uniref:GRF-type domain-containing protein n=1 Tax=Brassica rapa subsp. trilocularis TaxID=1813537 RepID=A0ABQ7LY09_BRACM|nr:hypothetical protein IGI04_021418 [Brassica rapa subsp. trilocularis]